MKPILNRLFYKAFACFCMLMALQTTVFGQDVKAEINGNDVGSWFSRNWVWITVVVVVLLLIILVGGSSRRSSRTTTVNNRNGHVQRTTTTEEVED